MSIEKNQTTSVPEQLENKPAVQGVDVNGQEILASSEQNEDNSVSKPNVISKKDFEKFSKYDFKRFKELFKETPDGEFEFKPEAGRDYILDKLPIYINMEQINKFSHRLDDTTLDNLGLKDFWIKSIITNLDLTNNDNVLLLKSILLDSGGPVIKEKVFNSLFGGNDKVSDNDKEYLYNKISFISKNKPHVALREFFIEKNINGQKLYLIYVGLETSLSDYLINETPLLDYVKEKYPLSCDSSELLPSVKKYIFNGIQCRSIFDHMNKETERRWLDRSKGFHDLYYVVNKYLKTQTEIMAFNDFKRGFYIDGLSELIRHLSEQEERLSIEADHKKELVDNKIKEFERKLNVAKNSTKKLYGMILDSGKSDELRQLQRGNLDEGTFGIINEDATLQQFDFISFKSETKIKYSEKSNTRDLCDSSDTGLLQFQSIDDAINYANIINALLFDAGKHTPIKISNSKETPFECNKGDIEFIDKDISLGTVKLLGRNEKMIKGANDLLNIDDNKKSVRGKNQQGFIMSDFIKYLNRRYRDSDNGQKRLLSKDK